MVDISITFPSIRNQNLAKVYDAIAKSCQQHSFEVIIASPYNIPDSIAGKDNVKWLKVYSSPSVAWQQCSILANSEFLVDGSDDALFGPDALDEAIEAFRDGVNKDSIINLPLKEGVLDSDTLELIEGADTSPLRPEFFMVSYNPPFYKKCINPTWRLSLNFLVKTKTFIKMGGFDTRFEYINHSLHDFVFRIQSLGGSVFNFHRPAMMVAHMPGKSGDHGPIDECQKGPDTDKFNEIYDNLKDVRDRAFINLDNWKNQEHSNWWTRRFGEQQ